MDIFAGVDQNKNNLYGARRARAARLGGIISSQVSDFVHDVSAGLSRKPKCIPSRWFYDERGSQLFSQIMNLDEYYPTRRETEILRRESVAIVSHLRGDPVTLVELGAGDGRKTSILLRAMMEGGLDFEYVPLDISASALEELGARLSSQFPGIKIRPMAGENMESLARVAGEREDHRRICVLFLGSSIGNFERDRIAPFLMDVRGLLHPGDMAMIGFDLLKEPERLIRAYSDSKGVTAEFNLNLLDRMNRELGANFQRESFRHVATWNPALGGMESWIVSLREQTVRIAATGESFRFKKWEPIRTEISLKFDGEELRDLARECGFELVREFEDAAGDFVDVLWQVRHQADLRGDGLYM